MNGADSPGQVVILNGPPRSGKSSIAVAIQGSFVGTWINLGVDVARATTPPHPQPGVGLRPGEPNMPAAGVLPVLYAALWESVAAHVRLGLSVVVDVGLYDMEIATDAARRLEGMRVLFVGVRCDIEMIMERRRAAGVGSYSSAAKDGPVPEPVLRWQREVHGRWTYDIEADTLAETPEECAARIRARLDAEPNLGAFTDLAQHDRPQ